MSGCHAPCDTDSNNSFFDGNEEMGVRFPPTQLIRISVLKLNMERWRNGRRGSCVQYIMFVVLTANLTAWGLLHCWFKSNSLQSRRWHKRPYKSIRRATWRGIGTPLEDDMWAAMKKQFEEDLQNLNAGNAISLLAKWIKTADASSSATRKLGILTAQKLGYPVYNFKRIVRSMRKQIGVVESLMSAGRWDEIKYPEVPSRAMMIYRKAFMKHDAERFGEFINKAEKGEVKINASTLFPYDIVEKILYGRESNKVLEAQWKALPDYVEKGTNALVMADVSGSMRGRPMATSIGLAIYFAERNVGAYHNLFMTFSDRPETVILRGETLEQKIRNVSRANWDNNTDLKAAFERVLEIAEKHNTPQEEMPKAIVVISDMEIDCCGNREWSFYDKMANKFRKAGYVIPNIIFWNVNSRHDVFHADHNRKGVQLASGQSVTVFKQILQNLGYNPVEAMENTINSERYDCITVE